jgi:hypothetical protein
VKSEHDPARLREFDLQDPAPGGGFLPAVTSPPAGEASRRSGRSDRHSGLPLFVSMG